MLAATKTAPIPLKVLLVGRQEEDFFLIREILERNKKLFSAELHHARSLTEAKAMLEEKPYGLIVFEHETEQADAVGMLSEFHSAGVSVPYIVLTEDADEESVASAIESGTWNCLSKSQLDGATLVRTIHNALAVHSLQLEQHYAEESLRKLSSAVEQSADSVMITNHRGVIEYVNPAFENLTGYCRDEACGQTPRIVRSGEQAADVYQELWKTILSGNVYRGILVNRKKKGDLYYIEESICPVRDASGQITHFISNGRDLTERLRLEAQLVQAQKMDAIGRLAGGVAHDFNNLLTIITSYSELALDSIETGSPLYAQIQEILLAARRAAELTRQLLAFSRKQPQALRIVDLNAVVSGIAKTLPRLIGEDIKFTFAPGKGLGPVRVDPVQIEQILMNLAANSRHAMPRGGHFRIETSNIHLDSDYVQKKPGIIPPGHYALITVSDDGIGIAQQDLSHIFEPFYTTKPAGQGTGLGLATVYGIVKQNKGFIWVYSESGGGTVFKIYLPCAASKIAAVHAGHSDNPTAARGTETVLVVEDEHAVRNATVEFLKLQGYRVLQAKDGVEALEVAGSEPSGIHIVVSDVVMPNMGGGELARELSRSRPEIKFLFVSGYAGSTVRDHTVVDLETSFLQKPYTLKQLSQKIRSVLAQSPARLDHSCFPPDS